MLLSDFRMFTKDLPDDYEIRLEGLEIVSAPFGPVISRSTDVEDFEISTISINTFNTSIIIENKTWSLDIPE